MATNEARIVEEARNVSVLRVDIGSAHQLERCGASPAAAR